MTRQSYDLEVVAEPTTARVCNVHRRVTGAFSVILMIMGLVTFTTHVAWAMVNIQQAEYHASSKVMWIAFAFMATGVIGVITSGKHDCSWRVGVLSMMVVSSGLSVLLLAIGAKVINDVERQQDARGIPLKFTDSEKAGVLTSNSLFIIYACFAWAVSTGEAIHSLILLKKGRA